MFYNKFKSLLKHFMLLIIDVFLFLLIGPVIGGIQLPSVTVAFLIILVLSLINSLLWPILSRISLSFLVLTLGFGTFLLDGIVLAIIGEFVPEVSVNGFALFTIPLLFAIINSFVSIVLDIHEDSIYYANVLKSQLQKNNTPREDDGYIFLEIDGLARDVLCEAIERGDMPTLKRWINSSHSLVRWQTDLSSQTGSSQAGILHGNNSNIPAFRWVEKENNNKIISSNGFSGSTIIEERISNGEGLLSNNGASRSNLFSGDASDYILTFSKFASKKAIITKTWYSLYSNPYFISRVLVLFIWDIALELYSRIRQNVKKITPRMHRNLAYLVIRGGANVVMREATTLSIIGDIYEGKYNTVYSTYMGYDEIAHHSGIRDNDSFYALKHIDRQFKQLENAINDSGNNYHIIVLSDHGQSNGPTFKQKYGYTLKDLVEENLPDNITIHGILHSNEDHFFEATGITNNKDRFDKVLNKMTAVANKNKDKFKNIKDNIILNDDTPIFDKLRQLSKELTDEDDVPDEVLTLDKTAQTIVLASGNLGLIYFTDWSNRLTYEQIEDAFPNLIHNLAKHPGIGFVMVKSTLYGAMVLSDDNIYYMDDDRYDGEKFLDVFGDNIIEKLKRTNSFEHVPDILVNSTYDDVNDEVYAFEELIGSHGGAGGMQQYPFILYPNNWKLDHEIVGSENVYQFFVEQMKKE